MELQLELQQDVLQGHMNPLYTSPVPDTSGFVYGRDTPLMPMYTPAAMINEALPGATFMVGTAGNEASFVRR